MPFDRVMVGRAAHFPVEHLTVGREQQERRNPADAVLLGQVSPFLIGDVHTRERDRITQIFFEPIDRGLGQEASRSEVGVQVDKDRLLRRLGVLDSALAIVSCARPKHRVGDDGGAQLQ